ncbi:MAG: hypothetical protein HY331_08500 [Chloroflexi bacterium]|nr:hypothetical protein [Chloroflexota bacterium]
MPVRSIIVACRVYRAPHRVRQVYPALAFDDIREAIAFYRLNREEIDRHIAENAE